MNDNHRSVAEESHCFTGLFEAELPVRLMLLHWNHPMAHDPEFASKLLESTAKALRQCSRENQQLLEDVEPRDMNFVAAIWYAEWAAVSAMPGIDPDGERHAWLDRVRGACPCRPRRSRPRLGGLLNYYAKQVA